MRIFKSSYPFVGVPACVALLAFCADARATVHNANSSFSVTSNPNGVWSYTAAGTLLNTSGTAPGGYDYWYDSGATAPNEATVAYNQTSSTATDPPYDTVYIPPGEINLDPQSVSNAAVVFTAPAAGTYAISGNFVGSDTGEASHTVEIDDNGTSVFSSTISSYQQSVSFSFDETLATGDTIASPTTPTGRII